MAKSYYEKLKDPRWQKKRLEVMELNNFECSECGDRKNTLNIHHPAYKKGADPWCYEADELMCVCEQCHKACHSENDVLTSLLFTLRTDVNRRDSVMFIAGFLAAFMHDSPFPLDVHGDEYAKGIAFFFKAKTKDVISLINNHSISSESIASLNRCGSIISDFMENEGS